MSRKLEFTKMQGLGNDYVYVNCFREKIDNISETAKRISDRHFGVGSDGLVLICPSEKADFKTEMNLFLTTAVLPTYLCARANELTVEFL